MATDPLTTRTLTPEEYNKLRGERENFPGIVVVGGHVVSDRFGEMYGKGPMRDDELPIELQTKDIDYPATEDVEDAKPKVKGQVKP